MDLNHAKEILDQEIQALHALKDRLDQRFLEAVRTILECKGRVVVTGIGKAGIIGQKISATLASTGTPSYSLHPVEAIHGDLGRILAEDVLLALSNSGETAEVVRLLAPVKGIGVQVISITGAPDSRLAKHSDVVIDIGKIAEACPLGLAPTASTTAMLAVGDALALTVARARNFDKAEYAKYHPGGELGRKLLLVADVMRTAEECPQASPDMSVKDALDVITNTPGRAGAVNVVSADARLVGIFTDGDLRRSLQKGAAFLDQPIKRVMTPNPKHIRNGSLAAEAAKLLKEFRIDDLPVVDDAGRLVGIVDVQDLLEVGII